jgi:hypothetical protein
MRPDIFDIFFITGQSNASGARDSATDPETERENAVVPEPGTAYCLDVSSKNQRSEIYDLNRGRSGIAPALALRWNELTGRGCFVVQTAVSGSPIQRWTPGESRLAATGMNFLDNTLEAAEYVLSLGQDGTGEYRFGDIYYIWCQGETGQAHEWAGDHWIMPGIRLIDTDSYYTRFERFHSAFLEKVPVRLGAIMLVRTIPRKSSRHSLELGLLTDMVPSKQAQYTAHACHGDTLRIMSRICDIARMETTPGPGAGFLKGDNVHYKKKGYNAQARELAENIYRFISPDTDRTPVSLEWLAPDGRTPMKEGQILPVDCARGALTAAVVLPLWADNTAISFTAGPGAEGVCSVDRYGKITFAPGTPVGTRVPVTVKADCGFSLTVVAECAPAAPADEVASGIVTDFVWNFASSGLTEYNSYNNLLPGENAAYELLPEGIRLQTNWLEPERTLHVSDRYDWKLRWKGEMSSQLRIMSGDQSRIDTRVEGNDGTCVRFCTSENRVFELPYKVEADENGRAAEDLTLAYEAAARRLVLSCGGTEISSVHVDGVFSGSFRRLLAPSSGAFALVETTMLVERDNA